MNTPLATSSSTGMSSLTERIVERVVGWLQWSPDHISPAREHRTGHGPTSAATSSRPAAPAAANLSTADGRSAQKPAPSYPVDVKHELAATAEIVAGIGWLFDQVPNARSRFRSLTLVEDSLRLRPEGGLMLIPQPALLRAMGQLDAFAARRVDNAWRSTVDRVAHALAAAALLQARNHRDITPAQSHEKAPGRATGESIERPQPRKGSV